MLRTLTLITPARPSSRGELIFFSVCPWDLIRVPGTTFPGIESACERV